MDRTQKQQTVTEMHEEFSSSHSVIVVHYRGMTVADITDLRKKARVSNVHFKVTKNRLTKRALKDTPFDALSDLFKGPTAVAYSVDEVSAAKTIVEFAKANDNLKILGGAVNATVLNTDGVKALASMPSLNESRAKIIGLITAPARQIASLLQAPGGQLARLLNAKATKGS